MKLLKCSMFFFVSACKKTNICNSLLYTEHDLPLKQWIIVTSQGGRKADQTDVNERYFIAKK